MKTKMSVSEKSEWVSLDEEIEIDEDDLNDLFLEGNRVIWKGSNVD